MRLLVDNNLSPRLAEVLNKAGWDAVHVAVLGLRAEPDTVAMQTALDDDRVLHWFAQNCDVAYDHPRLTRIPIGLDNPIYTKLEKRLGFAIGAMRGKIPFDPTFSHNSMGHQAQLNGVKRRMTRTIEDKPARVLCTFHRNQQLLPNADTIPDRAEAYAVLRDHPDCYVIEKRLRQEEYWRVHDDFAFEVSPRGKGLDCFRTWECLFLGTIPIVKTSPLDALYRQEQFPVVIVESYEEITSANLRRWKTQLEGCFTPELIRRLSNDYWLERIRSASRLERSSCSAALSGPRPRA